MVLTPDNNELEKFYVESFKFIKYKAKKENKGYKMTMKIGIRDLVRNSNILDYLEVEDKKTHEYKGLFVSPKYADEFKAFLEEKISKEKLDEIEKFAGSVHIEDRFVHLSDKQIREQIGQEKYGE